jgi:hypothetical protein
VLSADTIKVFMDGTKKLRRFYHKMNNPCGRIMRGDVADNNCYAED